MTAGNSSQSAALARPETLLLLFVLLFSPLAFGTVEPWSRAIAEGAAILALAIALQRRNHEGRLRLHAFPGALPLLLFLGLLLLQVIPVPPSLLHALSPVAHARWAAALGSGGPLPWMPISLDPLATLRELFRFGACAAVYALTVQLLARHDRLRGVTTVLTVFVAALSFEAIVQSLLVPRRLLFVREAPSLYPFGPFVNRNHYANLMAMLAPVIFGLFLSRGARGGVRTVRERLVDLLARPESGVRLLLGFTAVLCAGSLVISLSRGGIVAVSAALFVFGACVIVFNLGRRRLVAAGLAIAALTGVVGWFGWEHVGERFADLRTSPDIVDSMRAGIWRDTVRMAADFPVFGAGIGSFERLYPGYRTVPGSLTIAHAHSDHLELLAGVGLVGFGLVGWFVAAVLLAVVRASRRRRDPPALYLAIGSLSGCVAFLVHGASDFSLAIGANALYFFFLLGLAVSASHTLGKRSDRSTLLGEWRPPGAVSLVATAVALLSILGHGAELAARQAWNLAGDEASRSEALRVPPASVRRLIELASRLQPLEPSYPAALARIAAREGNTDEALRLTRRSLRLLPIDDDVLAQLGAFLVVTGQDAAARQSYEAAVAANPAAALHREAFGSWLLTRDDSHAAVAHLREALALEPERAPGIFGMLILAGFSDDRISEILPPDPAVILAFARYSTTTGARRIAGDAYRRVLLLDPGNQQAAAGLRGLDQNSRVTRGEQQPLGTGQK